MMKIILFLVLFLTPVHAYAGFCSKGELQLDFIDLYDGSVSHARASKARVHGFIETPSPGYVYSLLIKPGAPDGIVQGVLTLHEKDTYGASAAVISEVEINQSFEIPVGASGIMIDVVKRFNWGAEYFKGDLKKRQSICLPFGQYKK